MDIDLDSYFREQLVFFYFNLTRKNSEKEVEILRNRFDEVLDIIKTNIIINRHSKTNEYYDLLEYLNLFYKLIAHTRDIDGKGEHDLSYMMIYVLYQYFPALSIYLIHRLIIPCENTVYGSWRDMKYLCNYVREHSSYGECDQIINICIEIMNNQLKTDYETWMFSKNHHSRSHISNIAKWIPRENKKFGWLFDKLVIHWSDHFAKWKISGYNNHPSYHDALNKCRKNYRKIVVLLNKGLETIEIKQCSQNWELISPLGLSYTTLTKQKKLFLGDSAKYNFEKLSLMEVDKMISKSHCSQKYKEFIKKKYEEREPNYYYHGNISKIPVSYFVKEANCLLKMDKLSVYYKDRCDILNYQWKILSISIPFYNYENMIPIIDMSYHMQSTDSESFYFAIGLAVLIAERSAFGRRILALDNNPVWINLENAKNFVSIIEAVHNNIKSQNNTSVSIESGIDLIFKAVLYTNQKANFIKNLKLVFLSNDFGNYDIIHYTKKSFKCLKLPSPQIILWNLSKDNIHDLPDDFSYDTVLFLSGFSNSLIRLLTIYKEKYNSFSFINEVLNDSRYNILTEYMSRLIK